MSDVVSEGGVALEFQEHSQLRRLVQEIVTAAEAAFPNDIPKQARSYDEARSIILSLAAAFEPTMSSAARARFNDFRWNSDGFWMRWNVYVALRKGDESSDYYDASRPHIEQLAARYLQMDWFKSASVDFAIVDALVTSEVCQFGETLRQMPGDGVFDTLLRGLALEKANNDLETFLVWYSLFRIGGFFAIYVVPITLLIYFGMKTDYAGLVVAGLLWGALYVVRFVYKYARHFIRVLLKRDGPREKMAKVYDKMAQVQKMLGSDVLSPQQLSQQLQVSSEAGAVWSQAVFSIVGRRVALNRDVWVTRI